MKKNFFLLIIIVFLIAVPSLPVGQASIKKTVLDERIIQDPLKSWSVTFTQPVNKGTIKKQNFSITDAKKRQVKVKLRLTDNGKKVTITPETPYKKGAQYYLTIKGNVKSGSNFLNKHTVLPFKVDTRSKPNNGTPGKTESGGQSSSSANQSNSGSSSGSSSGSGSGSSSGSNTNSNTDSQKEPKILLNVEAARHSHFVEVSVQVSEQVVKVKAGNDEFEYKGNNEFTLYKPGLTSGKKLVIKGYSISNKTLEKKEIVIP